MLLDARSYPIQRVLEQYLEPKNLAYALRLWSTHYITKSTISLQRFVDEFYSRQRLTISSYQLYSDLLPAMMSALQARSQFTGELIDGYEFPDYDLGGPSTLSTTPITPNVSQQPDITTPSPPAAEIVLVEPPKPTKIPATPEDDKPLQPPRDENFVIFSSFIRQLVNGINPDRRQRMLYRNRAELKGTCKPEAGELLYIWLQSDFDYFQHTDIGITEMSAITHVIYMGLCEYLGPVDADRILMKVTDKVSDTYPFASLDINQLL